MRRAPFVIGTLHDWQRRGPSPIAFDNASAAALRLGSAAVWHADGTVTYFQRAGVGVARRRLPYCGPDVESSTPKILDLVGLV